MLLYNKGEHSTCGTAVQVVSFSMALMFNIARRAGTAVQCNGWYKFGSVPAGMHAETPYPGMQACACMQGCQ
jgi:hypothetical protein